MSIVTRSAAVAVGVRGQTRNTAVATAIASKTNAATRRGSGGPVRRCGVASGRRWPGLVVCGVVSEACALLLNRS
jgi:hypothetical protein